MGTPKDDPALHSIAGIEAVLDETIDQKGFAVEYGEVHLGTVYAPRCREIDASQPIPSLSAESVAGPL